jgi:hypothetical protein
MVTIERMGSDVCALTGREGEGVFCAFADGSFKGFLCWKSLKQLLSLRQRQEEVKDAQGLAGS